MAHSYSLEWIKSALPLYETLNLFSPIDEKSQVDNEILETWQKSISLDSNDFNRRLSWDRLQKIEIAAIRNLKQLKKQSQLPIWTETYAELVKHIEENGNKHRTEVSEDIESIPFSHFLIDFVMVANKKIENRTSLYAELFSLKGKKSIQRNLLNRLSYICGYTLELKFSVFRAFYSYPNDTFVEAFEGKDNNRKVYNAFIDELRQGQIIAIFDEYPILARLVSIAIDQWVANTLELISRYRSDRKEIQEKLVADTPIKKISEVTSLNSDFHNGGKKVQIIRFEESDVAIVYKPRSLSIYLKFYDLCNWINTEIGNEVIRSPIVVQKDNYGWVEHIEHSVILNTTEIETYYYRAGVLLGVLHFLGATDFHHQNIIASNGFPVPVDLETLFHPLAKITKNIDLEIDSLIDQVFWQSVLRTGLLPRWEVKGEPPNQYIFDGSGFGSPGKQESIYPAPVWIKPNTDHMALKTQRANINIGENIPKLRGEPKFAYEDTDKIIEGFETIYSFFFRNKERLLSKSGVLNWFKGTRVRFVPRNTTIYSSIIEESILPKNLKYGIYRSFVIDKLSSGLVHSSKSTNRPLFWNMLSEEREAVEQLDIPHFEISVENTSLELSQDLSIPRCFEYSGIKYARERIQNLSKEDMRFQVNLIRGTLLSSTAVGERIENKNRKKLSSLDTNDNSSKSFFSREESLKVARAIGDRLHQDALIAVDGSVAWLTLTYFPFARRYQLSPTDINLYDGQLGIALFLFSLANISQEDRYHTLAMGALKRVVSTIENNTNLYFDNTNIGGMVGIGSLIYGLTRINQISNEPYILEMAEFCAENISTDKVSIDKAFDIVHGSAGAILGLMALYQTVKQDQILEKIIWCADHILENYVLDPERLWEGKLLTGFSHGLSGVAYAIISVYQIIKDEKYLEFALKALEIEDATYSPLEMNWPDFREKSTHPTFMTSWCHGAPGIGMSRLRFLEIHKTDLIEKDLDVAIEKTLKFGVDEANQICCGNFGRLDFLLKYATMFNSNHILRIVHSWMHHFSANFESLDRFPLPGTNARYFNPSLFQGYAGIGYQFLRFTNSALFPSVLLLENN